MASQATLAPLQLGSLPYDIQLHLIGCMSDIPSLVALCSSCRHFFSDPLYRAYFDRRLIFLIRHGRWNTKGLLPFVYASRIGHMPILRLLLWSDSAQYREAFAGPFDSNFGSALAWAARMNRFKTVEFLIRNWIHNPPTSLDPYITETASLGHLETLQVLLAFDQAVTPKAVDSPPPAPLLGLFCFHIESKGEDFEYRDAFFESYKMGHLHIIRYLLSHCRQSGLSLNLPKYSLLFLACEQGRADIVQFLIKDGIDLNFGLGRALRLAHIHHRDEVYTLLVQNGASSWIQIIGMSLQTVRSLLQYLTDYRIWELYRVFFLYMFLYCASTAIHHFVLFWRGSLSAVVYFNWVVVGIVGFLLVSTICS
ncbi:uncharacterized protein BJ171DRAFT_472043 [Polychytrium aggregatum]|uniref:uncharacterized protein n=1 Tax=Polychytrium aggregatum TaxID=110093 RepID=UPI0022FEE76B|nr:uncharacterized protein BJ171DRAFT_584810 [Polychytrium aggregatum]XP_052970467.1 uncharacterized protein BJ171DRAFT_472043 [Polychytrium aggregatum]KAI9199770.1 hypothetical protein BJ171DRAFT_584810 [Polychytrium aggregatum]KAI9208387.1 hypothetical protein BJ171DRAFT_472043 [Polychytrium aggregatum]